MHVSKYCEEIKIFSCSAYSKSWIIFPMSDNCFCEKNLVTTVPFPKTMKENRCIFHIHWLFLHNLLHLECNLGR